MTTLFEIVSQGPAVVKRGVVSDHVNVQPANESGISIDHRTKSYRRTAAMKGSIPPLISIFERLASSRGEVKQDLRESGIDAAWIPHDEYVVWGTRSLVD